MLNVNKVYGKRTHLIRGVNATDTKLYISVGDGYGFAPTDNSHYYLTLYNGSTREVVKVVGRNGDILEVVRGEDNTEPQTFPANSCVKIEWNPQQLCEFIKQCTTNDVERIKPQTICMTCDTCLDIDAMGHVVKVNGGTGC